MHVIPEPAIAYRVRWSGKTRRFFTPHGAYRFAAKQQIDREPYESGGTIGEYERRILRRTQQLKDEDQQLASKSKRHEEQAQGVPS